MNSQELAPSDEENSKSNRRSIEDLSKEQLINLLKKLREAAKCEKAGLSDQIAALSSEKENLKTKSLELINKYRELQSKNKSLEDSSQNAIAALQRECEQLSQKINNLKAIKGLQPDTGTDNSKLVDVLEMAGLMEKSLSEKNDSICALQKANDELKAELDALKTKNREAIKTQLENGGMASYDDEFRERFLNRMTCFQFFLKFSPFTIRVNELQRQLEEANEQKERWKTLLDQAVPTIKALKSQLSTGVFSAEVIAHEEENFSKNGSEEAKEGQDADGAHGQEDKTNEAKQVCNEADESFSELQNQLETALKERDQSKVMLSKVIEKLKDLKASTDSNAIVSAERLESLTKLNDTMQSRVLELERCMSTAEERIHASALSERTLEAQVAELEADLKIHVEVQRQLREKIDHITVEKLSNESQFEASRSRFEEESERISEKYGAVCQQLSHMQSSVDTEMNSLKLTNKILSQNNDTTESKLRESESKLRESESKLQESETILLSTKSEIEAQTLILNDLNSRCTALETSNLQLNEQVSQQAGVLEQASSHSSGVARSSSDTSDVSIQISELQSHVLAEQKSSVTLKEGSHVSANTLSALDVTLQDMKQDIEKSAQISIEVDIKNDEIKTLKEQIKGKDDHISALLGQLLAKDTEIACLIAQQASLVTSIEELRTSNSTMECNLVALNASNTEMSQAIIYETTKAESLNKEKDQLRQERDQVKTTLTKVVEKLKEKNAELVEKSKEFEELQESVEEQRQQDSTSAADATNELSEKIRKAEKQLVAHQRLSKQKIDDLQQQVTGLMSNRDVIHSSLQYAQEELKDKSKALEDKQCEVNALTDACTSFRDKLQRLTEQHKVDSDSLANMRNIQAENGNLQSRVNVLNVKLSKSEEDLSTYVALAESLQAKLASLMVSGSDLSADVLRAQVNVFIFPCTWKNHLKLKLL